LQKLNAPLNRQYPNPDKPVGAKRKSGFIGEPKKINQESTQGPRLNKKARFNGAGKNTQKNDINFVRFRFRLLR